MNTCNSIPLNYKRIIGGIAVIVVALNVNFSAKSNLKKYRNANNITSSYMISK
jgi:hypothetical protein